MGPLFKHLRPEASEALRLAKARGLRVLEVVGGSLVHILCVQGGPVSNSRKGPGGSPF